MQHRFVQLFFSLAIAAIFLATIILGINVFVPHPDFNKERSQCYERYMPPPVSVEYKTSSALAAPTSAPSDADQEKFRQQEKDRQACSEAIDTKEHAFAQKAFLIAVLVGVLGVALSVMVFAKALPLAASGMTLGGLLSILYGMIRGLSEVDKRWMFAVAVIAFLLLLWVAWWRSRGASGEAQEKKN